MKKIILILLAIAAIASSCEKYNLNRIYGYYTLTSYQVNGVDSLSLYKDSLGVNFQFYYEEVNSANGLLIDGNRTDGNYTHVICQWNLKNHFTILEIKTAYGNYGTGPIGYMRTPEWEILSLKNEFKMKTTYNGKEYVVELKQI